MSNKQDRAVFSAAPDPGRARTLADLIELLRLLKVWAADPSYETITWRVNELWRAAGLPPREWTTYKNTVAACFVVGRRQPKDDLLLAIVEVLNPDPGYVAQWRQALRIVRGEAAAAMFVRAHATLPDDSTPFIGRAPELASIMERSPGAVPCWVIEGMPGIGKTQLAVHVGHLLLRGPAFTEVLFANLRGFHDDPWQPPVAATAVLDTFLRVLGLPGRDVPHDLAGRARRYRELLRDRRVLVVLDNAADVDQVRPLVADAPNCLTLVTSRHPLTDLLGARRLPLDGFTESESLDLLRAVAGAGRIDAEPGIAASIASACGNHPHALALTSSRISAQPDWTLVDHLARLTSQRASLRIDDAVETSIGLSYDLLPARSATMLRRLALHPGEDLSVHAAAAVAGTSRQVAEPELTRLTARYLLRQRGAHRYQLHDLVRTYVLARGRDEDPHTERGLARTRLFVHYLHTAARAMDRSAPHERHLRPVIAMAEPPEQDFADAAAARAWLDAERANLVALGVHAADESWPEADIGSLALVLHRHLHNAGYYHDVEALLTRALADSTGAWRGTVVTGLGLVRLRLGRLDEAADSFRLALTIAENNGDRVGEGRGLINLGVALWQRGDHHQAALAYHDAFIVAGAAGDRLGEGRSLNALGTINGHRGRYAVAQACFTRAATIAGQQGDPVLAGRAQGNLGVLCQRRADYFGAIRHHDRALMLAGVAGDRAGEVAVLASLAGLWQRLGYPDRAIEHGLRALAVATEIGDRTGEINALVSLAVARQRLGDVDWAVEHGTRALTLAREIGDRGGAANALCTLAVVAGRGGRPSVAVARYYQARVLAVRTGDRSLEAEVCNGLGEAVLALGMPVRASQHHYRALRISDEIRDRHEQVRAHRGLVAALRAAGQFGQAAWHRQCYEALG
ncbi:tetratricopeptide repeat protein [Amycolatopsis sp., V23-08]|uniref:Tetratricopeptide repeat protein n=1 Tax=Amycolatopsis heterodermiae TaxID=3110235 RepID=A0ABU5RDZ3_9PSEU|nr:tetratricopeptide repeat protein [Amycolatopsis sp., V23-08]MEA5364483.1 tetratricopeptide repeat protein [Amycolatopsis sp., V23-08]